LIKVVTIVWGLKVIKESFTTRLKIFLPPLGSTSFKESTIAITRKWIIIMGDQRFVDIGFAMNYAHYLKPSYGKV